MTNLWLIKKWELIEEELGEEAGFLLARLPGAVACQQSLVNAGVVCFELGRSFGLGSRKSSGFPWER